MSLLGLTATGQKSKFGRPKMSAMPSSRARFNQDEAVLLTLETDRAADGAFGVRTLEVTAAVVRMREVDGSLSFDLPVRDIASAKAEPLVGGGALKVTTHAGRTTTVALYSQTLASQFAEAARGIEQLTRHEPWNVKIVHQKLRCPKCGRLLPEPDGVCPHCVSRLAMARRMTGFLKPYKREAITLAVLSVLATGATLVGPVIQGHIIDGVFSKHGNYRLFILLLLAWVGLLAASTLIQVFSQRLLVRLAANISADLRSALFRTIEFLNLAFIEKKSVGNMANRVVHESNNIWGFLSEGLPFLITNTLMMVGVVSFLFYVNWVVALCCLVPMPIILITSVYFWKSMGQKWFKAGLQWARLNAVLHDSLSGMRVIKVFAQEDRENKKFASRNRDLRETGIKTDSYFHMLWGMVSFVLGMGTLTLWAVGGYMVVKQSMTLGDFWKMQAFLLMAYGPLNWFANFNNWFSRANASAGRIFEVLDAVPEAGVRQPHLAHHEVAGEVSFRDVTFAYEKGNPVLKNVSFTARPGEMIGLIGKSGSGKSTTINLICRFFEPDSGSITIDGIDYRNLSLQDMRRQIGVVLQEPFLFDGTIAENIAYAKPEATLDEIMEAARAANAHGFIMSRPDGYDSPVGERGSKLSGGERQRISIARAILHDPKILILDEATSSVDVETEKQIQDAITRLVKGRTTFAIAHRLSTLRNASRLIVLDRGNVAEIGTHAELLDQRGHFHRLVETQAQVNQIVAA